MAVDVIGFHVTDRCQLDCQHCLRDPAKKPLDIDVGLVRRILGEAHQTYRARHVVFTGGEPTLHPAFAALVDAALDQGFSWHMVTNGHRLASVLSALRTRPERWERMTSVTLSLDGAREETHDAIRGSGSYRDVMHAAAFCTATEVKFAFNATLHARNVAEIEQIGMLAGQLGAAEVAFSMAQPTGTHHDQALQLSAKEWHDVVDRLRRLQDMLKLPVRMNEGFPKAQLFHTCSAFTSDTLHIDVHGRMNLCCQHSGVPSANGRSDVVADLHDVSFHTAHRKFLSLVHEQRNVRMDELATGNRDAWDEFPCNACLKSFGKPHWTEVSAGERPGVGGAEAKRERWRGAWDKKRALPIVR